MKPEAKFKTWLVKKIRDLGYFVQTIETTTGRGVPDLVAVVAGKSVWIEVKVSKPGCTIRAEQYIWHLKAGEQGVVVLTVCQNPDTKHITIYRSEDASKRASGWKLTNIVWSFPAKDFENHKHMWLHII